MIVRPGPILYDANVLSDDGTVLHRKGTIAEEGKIWLVECPVADRPHRNAHCSVGDVGCPYASSICTIGQAIAGLCPRVNMTTCWSSAASMSCFRSCSRDLVLQYKWLPALKLSDQSKRGLDWLRNEKNRMVGPVEWDQVDMSTKL